MHGGPCDLRGAVQLRCRVGNTIRVWHTAEHGHGLLLHSHPWPLRHVAAMVCARIRGDMSLGAMRRRVAGGAVVSVVVVAVVSSLVVSVGSVARWATIVTEIHLEKLD